MNMETLVHADIFFFITTVFVVIVGTGIALVIAHMLPVLKNMRRISEIAKNEAEKLARDIEGIRSTVKEETDKLVRDIDDARSAVKSEGDKAKMIVRYFFSLFPKKSKPKKRSKKEKNN